MDLINRVKNIIVTPKTEWNVIATESSSAKDVMMSFIVPLTAIAAIAAFIGYGFVGYSFLSVRIAGIQWGIYNALLKIIMGIASVYITAYVVDALAPSFNSEKDFGRSVQLVAYGATPGLVAAIFAILPAIAGILSVAGAIYSIYLWYLGLGPIKKTPEDKRLVYLIVTFVILIFVYIIIGYILSLLLMPAFGLNYSYGSYNM
ncbi:MAG: Yip1 family protein [Ilyomonas sp.]